MEATDGRGGRKAVRVDDEVIGAAASSGRHAVVLCAVGRGRKIKLLSCPQALGGRGERLGPHRRFTFRRPDVFRQPNGKTGGMWRKTLERALGRKRMTQARAVRRAAESPVFYVKHVITKPTEGHRLHEIGRFCGTNKADEEHTFYLSYLDVYERYFEPMRDEPIRILEIGVKEGCSLRMWKSYFRNGLIYGLDIDPACKTHEEDRISIEIGSQEDPEFLHRCFRGIDKFDVIIDDGSHINRHLLASFECLFNERLSSGGIYVMEDLWCSYQQLQTDYHVLERWPGMKCNDPNQNYNNDRQDMDIFFLNKIKALDYFEGNILAMHFWSNMCFIVKV